jgi:hypothetical protein
MMLGRRLVRMTSPTTYKERIQIQTLRGIGWTQEKIANSLNFSRRQVQYACNVPSTPRKRCGPRPALDTSTRRRVVDFVTASAANHRLPL